MTKNKKNTCCFSCSIFQNIIESNEELKNTCGNLHYISSVYHMYPAKLEKLLENKIAESESENIILLYGDCHPSMHKMEKQDGVKRLEGINCIDIFLEKEDYRRLRKDGAFFLLPEWANNWEKILEEELGLHGQIAKDFFRDMHTKIVYIDTGDIPIPHEKLKEVAEYTGLKVEFLKTNNQTMLNNLKSKFKKLKSDG